MARVKPRKRGRRFASPADLEYQRRLVGILSHCEALTKQALLSAYPSRVDRFAQTRLDAPNTTLGAIVDGIRLRIQQPLAQADGAARDQAVIVERKNRAQNNQQANKLLGVQPFASDPGIAELVSTFADLNAAKIKGLADTAVSQTADIVSKGLLNGVSTAEMGREISERFDVAKSRAKFIARDQTATLNSQLTQVRMQSIGIDQYEWSTSKDERVRPEHEQRDGRIYSFSNPPADGNPGEAVNCRCVAIPIAEF